MSSVLSRSVTFQHSFQLSGMDAPHPPGTFELTVEEEQLDVMWAAHRTSLRLMLGSLGRREAWPITASELEALLLADRRLVAHGS